MTGEVSTKKILLLIGLISIAVLIPAIIWNDLNFSFFLGLLFDDAKEFAYKGTIVSDFMPIGYSGYLGACLKIAGLGGIPACQIPIYIGIMLVVFWFLRAGGARGILLILGFLVTVFHPILILNIWRIHDGNLTALLILGFLTAGISFLRFSVGDGSAFGGRNGWSIFFLGIFAGLLFTIRANTILLVLPALLLFFKKDEGGKIIYFWKSAFLLVSVMAVVFMTVNIALKQKPFFFPQYGFYNFFAGANEHASKYLIQDYGGENSVKEALRARGFFSIKTYGDFLTFPPEKYKEFALDYIKGNPVEYVKLAGLKFFTLLRPGYRAVQDFRWFSLDGLKRFSKIIFAAPFFIWMFFVVKTREKFFEKENLLVFLTIVLYLLPFLIANADPRYRFPLDIIFIADSFRRAGRLPFFSKG